MADVAGGWGQVTKQANNQYSFDAKIIVGDGASSTYFVDTNKQIVVSGAQIGANWDIFLRVRVNATVTFGSLLNSTTKECWNGCNFLSLEPTYRHYILYADASANALLNCYSCTFNSACTRPAMVQITNTQNLWYCHFDKVQLKSATVNLYQCTFTDVQYDGANYHPLDIVTGTIDKLWINSKKGVKSYTTTGVTISNAEILVTGANEVFWGDTLQTDCYFINVDCNRWEMYWSGSPNTAELYRQYTYDLTVLNGEITEFVEDANVTLSKGGVQIGTWLTNSSGQIETQTLTYGYYNSTGGDTMYDGSNPFVLTVTHEDWADYTSRFYVTEKTKMTISMQDTTTANNAALIWSMLFGTLAFAVFFVWWVRR